MNFKKNSTFVGHFCPPGSGSGSTDPIESESHPNTDPNPQPWTQARRAARHQARFLKRSGETVAACAALLARLEAEILAEAELITSVRFLFGATPHNPKVRDTGQPKKFRPLEKKLGRKDPKSPEEK
jgi:hypothetical protein